MTMTAEVTKELARLDAIIEEADSARPKIALIDRMIVLYGTEADVPAPVENRTNAIKRGPVECPIIGCGHQFTGMQGVTTHLRSHNLRTIARQLAAKNTIAEGLGYPPGGSRSHKGTGVRRGA